MKKPTLKQLIESAEKEVNPEDWYRQKLLLDMFKGMSKTTLNEYQKEMETIPEFAQGILKPGHSSTYIHVYTFLWYLRWKDTNNYRRVKISPEEILNDGRVLPQKIS